MVPVDLILPAVDLTTTRPVNQLVNNLVDFSFILPVASVQLGTLLQERLTLSQVSKAIAMPMQGLWWNLHRRVGLS